MPLLCSRNAGHASLRKTFALAGCVLFGFILGSEMRTLGTLAELFSQYSDVAMQQPQGSTADTPTSTRLGSRAPHRAAHVPDANRRPGYNVSLLRGGYKSPVESMFGQYSNGAVACETHKHDRWVVDSLAYLHTFDGASAYGQQHQHQHHHGGASPSPSHHPNKPLTIIILTVNRAVPYLAVNLATLLRGHSPEVFAERLNVHVANLEKRPGRSAYRLLDTLRAKLPFVTFHTWTETSQTEHANIHNRQILFLEQQKVDYLRALRLCRAEGSKWCVIMEDDAVPPVNFALKFDRFVNRETFVNASINGRHDFDVDSVGMVKLYVPHNDGVSGKDRLVHDDAYAASRYDEERAVDLVEGSAIAGGGDGRMPDAARKVEYRIKFSTNMYGVVANAYPRSVLDRIIEFLDDKSRTSRGKPTDVLLTYNFVISNKLALLETNPSLCGHVGYYSENRDAGRTMGGISTDVRFQLDDGPEEEESRGVVTGRSSVAVAKTNRSHAVVRGSFKRDGANANLRTARRVETQEAT